MNPKIIQLQKIGSKSEGYLSIAEQDKNMPFEIKRVFCTYDTPTTISRGRHAHRETEMILCAIAGEITVTCICSKGKRYEFHLKHPYEGLWIPNMCWHEMFYSEDAIQLVLASTPYAEEDYIRSFKVFQDIIDTK